MYITAEQCNNSSTTTVHYTMRTTMPLLLYLRCGHTEASAHPDAFARASTSAGRSACEHRFHLVVCTHAHVPTARSGAETSQGGAPAIPILIGSDKKSTYNADMTHQQQSITRYIGCFAVFINRSPAVARSPPLMLVEDSSTRTDAYPASRNMYPAYYCRYWCICCVHISLTLRRSPAIARPPPVLLAVRSSYMYQLL